MPRMTGARFIAETVHGYGITHVFFMPYIGPRALMEMENLGIKRIQTHGEKAAAYMADALRQGETRTGSLYGTVSWCAQSRGGITRCLSCLFTRHCVDRT